MSATTQDPTKYYRTGVAMKVEDRPLFEARIKELGLATTGDLVSLFVRGPDSLVEAMKPGAAEYLQARTEKKATTVRAQTNLARQLSAMTPAEVARLMELAKAGAK